MAGRTQLSTFFLAPTDVVVVVILHKWAGKNTHLSHFYLPFDVKVAGLLLEGTCPPSLMSFDAAVASLLLEGTYPPSLKSFEAEVVGLLLEGRDNSHLSPFFDVDDESSCLCITAATLQQFLSQNLKFYHFSFLC